MVMRMLTIVAIAVVHEQMHQRAGEQQQKRQSTKEVGTVFREQEETRNCEKTIEYPARPGKVLCFVLIRHGSLLFQYLIL
jgi:hypothetical protein